METYVLDVETSEFKLNALENYIVEPDFFIIMNEKQRIETFYFNENERILEYFKGFFNENKPKKIYCHNLDFDYKFLIEYMPKQYNIEMKHVGGKLASVRYYKQYDCKKTVVEFRDSLVLLLTSLKKIGDSLQLPKLEVDYAQHTKEYMEIYCERDNLIVLTALSRLIDFVNDTFDLNASLDKLPLTLPSLSKRSWFKLVGRRMELIRIPEWLEEFLRKFYFGGRVEVFSFKRCMNGAYNDFNSFYPAQMERDMPIPPYNRLGFTNSQEGIDYFEDNPNAFAIICDIEEGGNIPLFPQKIDTKLIFGVGHKQVLMFREEYEYAKVYLDVKILRCKYVMTCDHYEPIFKEFIEKTYYQRKKLKEECRGNEEMEKKNSMLIYLYKIFMNSLYGKFAESHTKDEYQYFDTLEDYFDFALEKKIISDKSESEIQKALQLISIVEFPDSNKIRYVQPKHFKINTNIVYSMYITAMARLELHKALSKSKKPFYCDSDSIVSDSVIEDSDELGRLKPEFEFDVFQALSCKEYSCIPKEKYQKEFGFFITKMKGFGNMKDVSFDNFISTYFDEKKQHRVTKLREIQTRHLNYHENLIFTKKKGCVYDKRYILPNLETRPINIDKESIEEIQKHNRVIIEAIIYFQTKRKFENEEIYLQSIENFIKRRLKYLKITI